MFFEPLARDLGNVEREALERRGELVAAVTNLAFCVELYLKGIAMLTGAPVLHTHDLLRLFRALPSDVQLSIDNCYRFRIEHSEFPNPPEIEFGVTPLGREPTEEEKATARLNTTAGKDVLSLLQAEKFAFEIWRYFFQVAQPSGPVCVTIHWYRMGALVNALQDQFIPPESRVSARASAPRTD